MHLEKEKLMDTCEDCGRLLDPNKDGRDSLCRYCRDEFERTHPHPLDIAEREWREDQNPSLEDFYDMGF